MTMRDVDSFIEGLDGEALSIVSKLHGLFCERYGLTPKLRFGLPFYYQRSWIMYLSPLKNGSVELCFTRGNELQSCLSFPDAKKRKQIRGITFHTVNEIDFPMLYQIVDEAIALDLSTPYASKRKSSQ